MPNKLIEYKRVIDNFIREDLVKRKSRLHSINEWGEDSTNRLLTFISNGKTIRGSLVLLASEAYGLNISNDVLLTASAMELIQSGLLIHDDIIDQDRTRRGADTLFVQYEHLAHSLNISEKVPFGRGMAMCIGDATFFLALELISETNASAVLMHTIAQEYTSVCVAQMQDITFGFSHSLPTEEEVLSLYRYKTARYTFSLPLKLGAILAGAPEDEITSLELLGEQIGILFQLHDDMLNLYGNKSDTGKPVSSDLREGKKTLIYLYLYKSATLDERKKLDDGPIDISFIYELLEKYHIQQKVAQKSLEIRQKAYAILSTLSIETDALRELIEFSEKRTK